MMRLREPIKIDFFAWSWKMAKYHGYGWLLYTALFYGVNQLNEDTPSFLAILMLIPMTMLVMYGVLAVLVIASRQPTHTQRWLTGAVLLVSLVLLTPMVAYGYVYGLLKIIGVDIQIEDEPFDLREFIKNNALGFARYATYAAVYFAVGRFLESQRGYYEARQANMQQELDLLATINEKQEHELTALQMQLSPHIQHALFNKLYRRALHNDVLLPDAILLMSEITAYATKAMQPNHALVPIELELEMIHKLAAITGHTHAMEKAKQYLDNADTRQRPVPRLSLVTLFENAIKFADTRDGQPPITLELDVQGAPSRLVFSCINKIGEAKRHDVTLGTGLANLRRRLSILFNNHASLHTRTEKGFYHAQLEIIYPLRE